MENNSSISVEDINSVVKDLSFQEPTQEQIDYIIKNYDSQVDSDPTGYWEVWVEDLLHQAGVKQS